MTDPGRVMDRFETEDKKVTRAFNKTGLKLVFQLMRDENWLNKPYREIANTTGMAVGTITNILKGLKQDGFLIPATTNKYKLIKKKELLEKWAIAYEEKLKPTLKLGTFRFLNPADFTHWKELHFTKGKTFWGGEPGGDLLTHYLQPGELTIYTLETRNELLKNHKLIPDEKGNIKAYLKFWYETHDLENIAPALLIYVDLINTDDRRCIETAKKVYDEYLQNNF